jgi:hypothetical protein
LGCLYDIIQLIPQANQKQFLWCMKSDLNYKIHACWNPRLADKTLYIPSMFFKKIVFKKVLKSFRRVLKSKNSLKS